MKNLFKLSLFVLFFSLLITTPTFAVTNTSEATVISNINFQNARIISQKDNVFNLSFDLSNGEGLQTEVKYGVKLIKQTDKGLFITDEKVFSDSLTINPNTSVKKNIFYTAPSSLSGDYSISLDISNVSGFDFGSLDIGKVKLVAVTDGIQILPETCNINIQGENKTIGINQVTRINPEQNLSLLCTALNSSKKDTSATPSFETRYRSSFGEIVNQKGGDTTPVSFKAGESKPISISLPKASTPQAYNLSVILNEGNIKSNPINVNYILNGASATIQSIFLDKDYYKQGDLASLSLVYSATEEVSSSIKVTNDGGESCAEVKMQTLPHQDFSSIKIPLSITADCYSPKITLTLTDTKGATLDQKEFDVVTTSAPAKSNQLIIFIIIIVLIIIIIIFIVMKRKKSKQNTPVQPTSIPMSIIVLFILSIVTLFGLPAHRASATTVIFQGYNINLSIGNSGVINPNDTITVIGTSTYLEAGYGSNGADPGPQSSSITAGIVGQPYSCTSLSVTGHSPSHANCTFSTSTLGSSTMRFTITIKNSAGVTNSTTVDVPFIVTPLPVVSMSKLSGASSIGYNTTDKISWNGGVNSSECTCSAPAVTNGCINFPGGVSGSFSTPNMTSNGTWTITCTQKLIGH